MFMLEHFFSGSWLYFAKEFPKYYLQHLFYGTTDRFIYSNKDPVRFERIKGI